MPAHGRLMTMVGYLRRETTMTTEVLDPVRQDAPRVVIAEDDVLLRSGLVSLLDGPDLRVVGQAGDATTFLDLVREQHPDVVVVDIRMPPSQTVEKHVRSILTKLNLADEATDHRRVLAVITFLQGR
jgi:DNA-binding NarL/FixJ family response regulator